jgi:hypothetical protein
MEAIRDRADLSMKTDTKETWIHKLASPLSTKETIYNTDSIYAGLPPPCIGDTVWLIQVYFKFTMVMQFG